MGFACKTQLHVLAPVQFIFKSNMFWQLCLKQIEIWK